MYYFHDFERAVTFDLAEELKKGERVLDIPALFPRNAGAEAFAARQPVTGTVPGPAVAIVLVALVGSGLVLAVYGWIHAGRGFRVSLSVLAASGVLFVVLTAVALHRHPSTSAPWIRFSIGPASGNSPWVNSTMIRSEGITLKAALATAYDMPAVRVIGPSWLSDTRYSINAVVSQDEADSFRPLLQEELKNRLRLETHLEVRPFDVFVLTASDTPRLERVQGQMPNIRIGEREVHLREASMEGLAGALQHILGKPVLDETGITGSYNLELGWEEDRAASVSAALSDRFGLRLTSGKRDLEALIVDSIRRDAALILVAEVGRITQGAPTFFRQRIADVLTIR